MSIAWSNKETFKFIDLYQSEPAIWDTNNALHKDKNKAVIGEQTEEETETPSARSNTEPKDMNIKIPVQRKRSVKPPELEKADKEMSKAFNTLNQAILNKDQQNKKEDDCDLYGRLLANKLRKYSDNERQEIMYEIDGLLLNTHDLKLTGNSGNYPTTIKTASQL